MTAHPTAIIEPGARVADEAEVGPYSRIGPDVTIGPGTRVLSHAIIMGRTTMGSGCEVHPGAVIGGVPQDLKYHGEDTELVIGNDNVFREYVTVNTGTEVGGGKTIIGNGNLLMAYVHVAHDCVLGDGIIVANATGLGGHILVEDGARISGLAAVHHFVTIGSLSFVGGCAKVVRDVPPFMVVDGNPAKIRGLNIEGLKRHGLDRDTIDALKEAYRFLYRSSLNRAQALEEIERMGAMSIPEIDKLVGFFHDSEQGRRGRGREAFRRDIDMGANGSASGNTTGDDDNQ